jgi:molybdate transport system ATP-binding protein
MLKVAVAKKLGAFSLDVAFELPAPGVAALFGPSGCGKTTTVNVIAGLIAPDTGRVTLDGTVLVDTRQGVDVAAERRGIGYVFQDACLFPHLNVASNLKFALRRAPGRHYVSLDEAVSLLDLGALMARRVHQLSGGERQRVAIGRALLSQPRLLLLDEPLAALDRERREEVLPYLESLRDRLAIPMVYVSHQFDEVLRLATHIVLIRSGTVVAQGGIGTISLDASLRTLVGPDAVGAVLDGVVIGEENGLTRVRLAGGELKLQALGVAAGTALRVQLLARDLIVSTQVPHHLSVRNSLAGVITAVIDDAGSDLIAIDIGGGAQLLARVTKAATRELALAPGLPAWALVKSVSLRGHSFASAATSAALPRE